MKVGKKSGKPFKSGNKRNTIKEVIAHPQREGKQAYTFLEDDSYVSVELCESFEKENEKEVVN